MQALVSEELGSLFGFQGAGSAPLESEPERARRRGSLSEKVNKGAGQTQKEEMSIDQNHVMLGIIVGLVILILCLLIAMLKMAIEKRKERS